MAQARDVGWWKRAAGLGPLWRRVRRLVPFCTLILRFHVEATQEMPASRRRALQLQLARNLERMLGEERCEECEGTFVPDRSRGGIRQRFCSEACRHRAARRRDYTKRERRSQHWGEQRRCAWCRQSFQRRRDDHRFCSPECKRRYHERRRSKRRAA